MRFLLTLLLGLPLLAAAEDSGKGVDLSLVSEQAAVVAGSPFTVGLKIHHHPGFHTYWRNPGIAGVPVDLAWKLPEGFTAGPIQWPYPERTKMAIHPVHGYERDVTLLVTITPPARLATDRIALQATASWMACADGCYPGKKDLSLALPVAPQAAPDPAQTGTFEQARKELPAELSGWRSEVLSAPDAEEIRIRFTPADPTVTRPEGLYFFSADGQISSEPVQRLEPRENGGFDIIAARAAYGPKGRSSLPGVLIAGGPLSAGNPAYGQVEPVYPGATAPAAATSQLASPVKKEAEEACCCEKADGAGRDRK